MSWKDYLILAAVGVGCLLVLIVIIAVAIKRHKRSDVGKIKKNEYPAHFRKFHEPKTSGHPQYVYGETETEFKVIGLTHHKKSKDPNNEKKKIRNKRLKKNPEPGKTDKSYMHPRPGKVGKDKRNRILPGWQLSEKDKKKARRIARKEK